MRPLPSEPAVRLRRAWSIRTRLLTFYVGSVALLLAAFLSGMYLSFTHLEAEDRGFLDQQVAFYGALVETAPDEVLSKLITVPPQPDGGAFFTTYVRVSDAQGRVIAEAERMRDLVPAAAFPAPAGDAIAVVPWTAPEGGEFFLASQWIDRANGGRRLLQVAMDESADERLDDALRRDLLMFLALGLIVATLLGVSVARSSLKPLTTLTDATAQVTATQLRARFETAGWPVELVRLADGFERMLSRLEESFERLSQFSANLSHELRTPISILRGEAEVALSKARTPAEYRAVIESSLEEYNRLSRLIDNLLFIARAESADISVAVEELDLAREVAAVIEFYEALAAEQQVSLIARGQARLRADSVLLRRALSNLVANALRYTPPGGKIEIAIERHNDGKLEIEVADTGAGIPPQHLARIYDRFYRADPPATERKGEHGFGLGLSIVKSIMELHQGSVSIESEVGRSTRVRLIFPASRVA